MKQCHFCGKNNHTSKICPIETQLSPTIKIKVGNLMEQYISKNVKCPKCNSELDLLDNHAPSLDCICTNCNSKFEVKSKCLSSAILPNDLIINHGNFNFYNNRQNDGLDFIIIIYGVDRRTKIITIRKIFFVPHHIIVNNKDFIVKQSYNLSKIFIKDHSIFCSLRLLNQKCDLSRYINHEIEKLI